MSGGGSTQTTRTEMDPEIKKLMMENYTRAGEIADRPYTPYTGQRIADFDPLQTQAQDFGSSFLMGNPGGAEMDAATQAARVGTNYNPMMISAPQFAGADLNPYLNPFQQNVIDTTMSQLDRGRQNAIMQGQQAATAAKAFGGSRHGIADAETNRAFGDTAANTLANLNMQNFNTAAGLFGQDAARKMQADAANQGALAQGAGINMQGAGLMGDLSGLRFQRGIDTANALSAIGAQKQGMEQQGLDLGYNQFMEEQNYPLKGLDIRQSALGMFPSGLGTQTTSSNQSKGGGQVLGNALMAGSMLIPGVGPAMNMARLGAGVGSRALSGSGNMAGLFG